MDNIRYAQINGVEIRDMKDLPGEEVLYSGSLYLDGREIGTIEEDPEGGPISLDVFPRYEEVLKSRINDYVRAMALEEGEIPHRDVFFLDLIDMQIFYDMYREGLSEGYMCLVVDASGEDLEIYSVQSEEEVENLVREKDLSDFEVYASPTDFIVSC
ncbi:MULTISPECIES: hypothetical protein [Dethiosulfovibrio]|uniref:Uncharacterized protein n=2 Tax=Dethiosulfovibrio TaxID=47054 RepID=A0ABS9EKM3_9BACT|nr:MULTISPECIES: hypothetical protein [Dethiosulfovibrio]MCF4112770.1 hypothetical protein [Dethiosulfovibrio russensis]MCF4141234.1 hypothetical protein [Dethiosulfovibrio marinus]MCF4144920.1 hypothetical protein [Dethiosulfovibrio acidaminovorans]